MCIFCAKVFLFFGAEEIGPRPLSVPLLVSQHSFPLPQPLSNQHLHTLPYQQKSTRLKILSFDTLAHSFARSATQLPLNQPFPHSLLKTRGWWVGVALLPLPKIFFLGKGRSAETPPTRFFSGRCGVPPAFRRSTAGRQLRGWPCGSACLPRRGSGSSDGNWRRTRHGDARPPGARTTGFPAACGCAVPASGCIRARSAARSAAFLPASPGA